ncbi:P-loop NTPase family protein [Pedobacter duraquae]|uniref:IstB-like ATP binding protein n=1 Tax=Pedobacter duraquae TaxID=425511 RepID=A0A4R6IJV3_9SPHI|nr:ATP-binding protein [Pedobacter duraquae]TDO22320.1 IstB-like ATP binding protein [Pedobacter duraquae]
MSLINAKAVFTQLKNDLIGKDSYRGVTLTYAWLANQFGHFALGFIPAIVVYNLIREKPGIHYPELWAALGVWAVWILFELYNFLGPLVRLPSGKKELNNPDYSFPPAWANVAFDTVTDLFYFGIGALTASIVCCYSASVSQIIIGMIVLVTWPAYYWYTTKMYIQYAEYPFQLRLSQWKQPISETNKKAVLNYIKNEENGKHLLLFGSKGSGKTTLAVGLSTEISINRGCCSYITAVKLLSLFYERDEHPDVTFNMLWNWRKSSLLVIDDINPGNPIKGDILSTAIFYDILDNPVFGPDNIKHIREKNIVWVMGTEDPAVQLEENWQTLLQRIGISKENITTINLDNH